MDKIDTVVAWLFPVFLTFCMVGAFALAFFAIRADGNFDYCHIKQNNVALPRNYYFLVAHRPWRDDTTLGTFDSLAEAKGAADLISCPLK